MRFKAVLGVGAAVLCFSASSTASWAKPANLKIAVSNPAALCASFRNRTIPASAFALPTGDAVVKKAALVKYQKGNGTYCRLKGAIHAKDAEDPDILFQVNLPNAWNRKTVLYGGGGSNGFIMKGTGEYSGGGGNVPTPLSLGYVTYGSDSGHQGSGTEFYANPTAFANYSHAAIKRTKDLVTALVKEYYGTPARRNYLIGGSKGGQEALQAAQRYYADFDGVVSNYPAAQSQSMTIAWNRMAHFAYGMPGGALTTENQALLKQSVLKSCDALDGATDGIVSNVKACVATFKLSELRCASDNPAPECLTPPQIAALEVAARPFIFAHPMPNGVKSVGPYPALLGSDNSVWFGNGTAASVAGFFAPAPVFPWALEGATVDKETWQKSVLATAQVYDVSSPDFDGFQKRGGKLILVQGTLDMLVPYTMTNEFFDKLQARYGRRVGSFVRYYLIPGFGHGSGDFSAEWDSLSALDKWVETGKAPQNPVARDAGGAKAGRTRPLCEYPAYPKYKGTGSKDDAASFSCVKN